MKFIYLFLLLVSVLRPSAQAAEDLSPHVRTSLIAEETVLHPRQTQWVGVLFEIEKHWHIYWQNPGDSGIPPKINWNLPAEIRSGDIAWPTPDRIPIGPLVNFGYADSVLLMVPLNISSRTHGNVELKAALKWLVCEKLCVPGRSELTLSLPVSNSAEKSLSPQASIFEKTRKQIPTGLPDGATVSFQGTNDSWLIQMNHFPEIKNAFLFPATANQIENAAPQVFSKNDAGYQLKIKKSDLASEAIQDFPGILETSAGSFLLQPKTPAQPLSDPSASITIITALFFAFLGGLVLNAMPCVFPILSIKALSLLNHAKLTPRIHRTHGLVYGAGVLISFWGLFAILAILKSTGNALGWGFQLQSPYFLFFLSCLLFVLGCNLLGWFEVGSSWMGLGGKLTQGDGYQSSFFSGVLASLVSTPCTAPFMGTAVGFAATQPTWIAFSVFTFLAIGFAVPYCILCFIPHVGRALPKPGRWMESLKQMMAFPLFGTVIWLLWVLGVQTQLLYLIQALIALLLISFAFWIGKRWSNWKAHLAVLMIILTVIRLAISNPIAVKTQLWKPYSQAAITQAISQGKPVLIDFTAEWCVTCKVNELVALHTSTVQNKLQEYGVELFVADWTNSDPEITSALAKFNRNGVPLYVLYSGKPNTAPEILPQILTPPIVVNALERMKKP